MGACSRSFSVDCPVACGTCTVCVGHPQYEAFLNIGRQRALDVARGGFTAPKPIKGKRVRRSMSAAGCICSKGCTSTWRCQPSRLCGTSDDIWQPGSNASALQVPLPPRVAIVLFLAFDRKLVRPKFQQRPEAAYEREFNRIKWLLRSAKRVQTRLPIYMVVGPERDQAKEAILIRKGLAGVIEGKAVAPPQWASSFHRLTFAKIGALALTQFDKVFVVDNDVTFLGNIDHLAYAQTPSAVWSTAMSPFQWKSNESCAVNSGVLGLSPSMAEFKRAIRHLAKMSRRSGQSGKKNRTTLYDGSDQAFFREFYSWYELPARYHAHEALTFPPQDWSRIRLLHTISGFRDRSNVPKDLRKHIRYFY